MANPNSITIKKDLVVQLQPIICCSETLSTCRDDEFCSSDPATWPTKTNGHETMRLSYPEEENSMEGAKEFCDNYLRWYTRSSCGTSDDRTKGTFDKSDLENVAMFCEEVKDYAATETNWRDFFKGAGGAGTIAAVLFVLKKILNFFKKGAEKLKETSETIDNVGKGMESVSASARHFFGVSLPTLGKALKYVFTFEWCRKKKTEEAKQSEAPANPTPTSAESKPAPAESPKVEETPTVPTAIPNALVVEAQLAELAKLEESKFEGKLFMQLSPCAKKYLSELAVRRWNSETDAKKKLFLDSDNALSDGKLPHDYLLKFARYHLKSTASVEVVEASARLTAPTGQSSPENPKPSIPSPEAFSPEPVGLRRQLTQFARFNDSFPSAQNYAARLAISDWAMTPREIQTTFISETDRPTAGELPQKFVRFFRKNRLEKMHYVEARARLFDELTAALPKLATVPFNVLDSRLGKIAKGWAHLPRTVKDEFAKLSNVDLNKDSRVVPMSFSEYMLKVIGFGEAERPAVRAAMRIWEQNASEPVLHRNIDISTIMEFIASGNSQLRHYPEILRARAALTLDAWRILHDDVKNEFVAVDDEIRKPGAYKGPESDSIPAVFVDYIMKINGGIGTAQRTQNQNPDDTPPTTTGGGGGGGSGGTFIYNMDEFSRTQEMIRPKFELASGRFEPTHKLSFTPQPTSVWQQPLYSPLNFFTNTVPMLTRLVDSTLHPAMTLLPFQPVLPLLK